MELFKYNNPDDYVGGQPINNWDSVAWTERYQTPGSFEINAKLSSGLRTFLPVGSFISHIRTLDIMMVEDHQISEDTDTDPEIKITGRSLQAILDQRVVGQNWNWAVPPASLAVSQYVLAAQVTWLQATTLINDHIKTGTVLTAGDAIPNLEALNDVSLTGTVSEQRTIARGEVLTRLHELLDIDNIGVRVIRRHNFPGLPSSGTTTKLLIHDGADKRSKVIFSPKNGDIDAADYLWSLRNYKTAALVSGKFVEQMVAGSFTGRNKRVMLVDGQDIDGHYETTPTGGTLTTVRNAMTVRGNQALKAQRKLELSKVDISSTPTYRYRVDYDIGDLVSVETSFGSIAPMRVVEHVEVMDENGESSYPTLEFLEV